MYLHHKSLHYLKFGNKEEVLILKGKKLLNKCDLFSKRNLVRYSYIRINTRRASDQL